MQTARREPPFWQNLANPLSCRSERRLLAGLALVSACSWGRSFFTGSLKVDESYPGRTAGFALLAALIAGWALAVAGWRGILETPPENPRRTAFLALGIAALMLPMLSNDLFSVLSYGSLAADGHDVYTTTRWLSEGPFSPWLGARWSQTVCVYGPTTLLATLPAGLARGNPWVGLAVLRLAWTAPVVLVMELSFRRLRDAPWFHAMVWLNPLWLVEGPGQLHADLLGLVAIVAGVLLHRAGKVTASFGLYAAALLGKYSFGPAGLWFWLSRSQPRSAGETGRAGRLVGRLATMGAVFVAAGVAFYAPFWHGLETITVPLRSLGRMNPGGSITEVLGIVVQYVRTGSVTPPDMAVQAALEVDRAAKQTSWVVVSWVMRVVFLGVAARVLPPMLRKDASEETLALGTGVLSVALLTLAHHRFQSWYLLAVLPFFGLACTAPWKRWWTAVVALSVPVEFACVLERSSPVYPVWGALTTGAVVVVFVAWFRGRYWWFPGGAAARRGTRAPAAP
jgi:hypothetical protein